MGSVVDGKVVLIHYTLRNDGGDILDASEVDSPLAYLHGADNIVPGLEKQIAGKSVGDKLTAVVPPAEGYGEVQGPGPQPVSRKSFPAELDIQPGMSFVIEDDEGHPMPLWVQRVTETEVWVDPNHPLAGETLHFEIEVVGVRDATAEEREHGHPHGPDGHDHH